MTKQISVALSFIVTLALAALGAGCSNSQSTNTNGTAAATPTAVPTPDRAAIEAELSRIENDWPRILKEHDAEAVRKVEADDILLLYPDGSAGSKDQDIKDIESGALSADSQEISELTVNILDNDSAVVRLKTTVKGGKYKEADGKVQDISGEFRSLDTFARRNGSWQLVASATVPVRNPTPAAAASSPAPKASVTPKAPAAVKPTPASKPTPARAASPLRKASPQ